MRRTLIILTLGLALVSMNTSCSFSMTRRDSNRHLAKSPRCNSSRAIPVIDGVAAISFLALAIAASSAEDEGIDRGPSNNAIALVPLTIGLPYFVSSLYGLAASSNCLEEKEKWAQWNQWNQLPPHEKETQKEAQLAIEVRSQLMKTLKKQTELNVLDHPKRDSYLLLQASNSDTCVGLGWSAKLAGMRRPLANLGIVGAECVHEGFSVWSGELDQLPSSAQDTSCGPMIHDVISEPDAIKRRQRIATFPPACRFVGKAYDWVYGARAAASAGDCLRARRFGDMVRRTDPKFFQRELVAYEKYADCVKSQ